MMLIECNWCHKTAPMDGEWVQTDVQLLSNGIDRERIGGGSYHVACYEEHIKPLDVARG